MRGCGSKSMVCLVLGVRSLPKVKREIEERPVGVFCLFIGVFCLLIGISVFLRKKF